MKPILMTFFVAASMALLGCETSSTVAINASADNADEHSHGDEHGHPAEGPHHGSLIELGNEEYHAEMVHDDVAKTVTVYLLDSAAKASVPIEATELLVNLSHDGKAEQFALAASPQTTDPSGKSSKFTSTDAELAEDLDHDGAKSQLIVTIGGQQYRGEIQHDHDHEGHEHGADGHDHDE